MRNKTNDTILTDSPNNINNSANQEEEDLLRSAQHITQARAQRLYANEMVRLAKLDKTQNLPFYCSRFVFTFDYAQNLSLPHYGEEQPGDTYYFTPLSMHVFGLVNHSPHQDHLYGFLYHEGQGKKGADNVSSIIIW